MYNILCGVVDNEGRSTHRGGHYLACVRTGVCILNALNLQ